MDSWLHAKSRVWRSRKHQHYKQSIWNKLVSTARLDCAALVGMVLVGLIVNLVCLGAGVKNTLPPFAGRGDKNTVSRRQCSNAHGRRSLEAIALSVSGGFERTLS